MPEVLDRVVRSSVRAASRRLFLFLLGCAVLWLAVALGFLNVLTGLWLLGTLFVGLSLLLGELAAALHAPESTRKGLQVAVVALALSVAGGELFLRYGLDRYDTYDERNGEFNYHSPHRRVIEGWFFAHEPNTLFEFQRPEFVHSRHINSLGLSEREIPSEKEPGEYRILVLGDSFTEGLGAPPEGAWPRVLERRLVSATGRRITVVNAGIIGSDVCFQYVLLRERLMALVPDLVVVAINNTDVADVMRRGGLERFQEDGSIIDGTSAPSWEWLFAISYLTRHVALDLLGLDFFLMTREERAAAERDALTKILATIRAFDDLAREHGLDVLVLLYPESANELAFQTYDATFEPVVEAIQELEAPDVIDLLPHYAERKLMTDEPWRYFWPLDAHYTPEGYRIMGEAVAELLLERSALGVNITSETKP